MLQPAGLCDSCLHQKVIRNTRGSSFSLCLRARDDDRFAKYPPLPVRRCPGYEHPDGSGHGYAEDGDDDGGTRRHRQPADGR